MARKSKKVRKLKQDDGTFYTLAMKKTYAKDILDLLKLDVKLLEEIKSKKGKIADERMDFHVWVYVGIYKFRHKIVGSKNIVADKYSSKQLFIAMFFVEGEG